jgi:aminoglycoside phosphotransferase (APT) family kinase protein
VSDDNDTSSAPKFHADRSHYTEALTSWYRRRFPERNDLTITDLEIPVATGFSNETVLFTARWTEDGQSRAERQVGRIEPTGGALFPTQTPACAVSVELQHRAMATVAAHTDVPVPPLLGFEPDPGVLGQPFFVMGHIDGRVPSDSPRYSQEGFLVDEATPEQRGRMVRTGLEAMAAIHGIDWRAADLGWLDASGSGSPGTATQIDVYRRSTATTLAGRDHPVLTAALDWLTDNDPDDDRIGLSWGDARIGNVIWQDYRPAAVLDWEAAALSPTEADIGWWLMFDRMTFDELDAPRMDGYPTREEMVAHYETVSGREVRAARYWEVFATMRFCAIFIGLGDRMTDAGLLPPERNPAVGNMVTESLARLIGIDNPTPSLI